MLYTFKLEICFYLSIGSNGGGATSTLPRAKLNHEPKPTPIFGVGLRFKMLKSEEFGVGFLLKSANTDWH